MCNEAEEGKKGDVPQPSLACTYLNLRKRYFPPAILAHLWPHGTLPLLVGGEGGEGEVLPTLPAQGGMVLAVC